MSSSIVVRMPGYLGGAILVILLLAAVFAPFLAPFSVREQHLEHRLYGPSSEHWLGADELGRDIFSRTVFGARTSLLVGITVVSISSVLGVLLGMISGYFGGFVDETLMRIIDILLAFPGILLAVALVGLLGPSLRNLILALCLIGWVAYARLVRGEVLRLRKVPYVEAVQALGASTPRIFLRHLLPNLMGPVVVQATLGLAGAILAEASLSFLGLGVQPPTPSWGGMLSMGRLHILQAPHLTIFPGLCTIATVMAFNFLGDALRDHLDPRGRSRIQL